MLRLLVLAIACLACKAPFTHLPLGTRVPMDELHEHRANIPGYIQAELDKGNFARAFYALELAKTRPYSQQALAARDKASTQIAATDLRPIFLATADTSGTKSEERGLVLVRANAAVAEQQTTSEVAFWDHMRRFEKRTAPLDDTTLGIPYDYAARYGLGVSTAEETGRLFGPTETFLSFFVHGEVVTVFVIVRGRLHVKRLDASATQLRNLVEQLVKRVRTMPQDLEIDSKLTWTAVARSLHTALLGPLQSILGDKVSAVFISPHGFLANLPFGLLMDARDRVLLEAARLTYVPSASIYRQLLARPILNRPPRMLAVGNAIYPEGVQPLEFAEREAVAVSELFPKGQLLRGRNATEAKVSSLAPTFNILHFATHGVLLGRTVPGGSSLLVTPDDTHDGFFSAGEIAGLDLTNTYIAVLSACETSVSEDTGRSIDLGTITNAFLTAGAPSVIGTMWQVNDAATTTLMLDFYQQFLEVGAGEALRRAQLALRNDPRYKHPYYWGAFSLFGWDK